MLTRRVDQDDSRAGFAHTWIARLASHPRVQWLDVICLEQGVIRLPENVSVASMGKEHGFSRPRQLWQFERLLGRAIPHASVVFGHMIPRYTLIAAPWARLRGLPLVQWYVHRQVTLELRLAHALVDRVVTASPESFTLPSRKVTVLGHGIDMELFQPDPPHQRGANEELIVAVGRLSPIKHYETLIDALAMLAQRPGFEGVRVEIAGGITKEHGEAYAQSLRERVEARGLSGRVVFLGPIPYRDVPALNRRAALAVNLCPTGGVDKAVLEGMACGIPVIVRNRTFLPLLGDDAPLLWTDDDSPATLADHLAAVLSLPPRERAALGERLHQRVRRDYDLGSLIDRLVGVFEEVIGQRKRR